MFIVSALVIFADVPMQVAVGASLMAVVATSAGAGVAFVRDGWTNLKVAIVLECATVTGAIAGAFLAGFASTTLLELLFALVMLQSACFSLPKTRLSTARKERPALPSARVGWTLSRLRRCCGFLRLEKKEKTKAYAGERH
jgi:uncharacterized protein